MSQAPERTTEANPGAAAASEWAAPKAAKLGVKGRIVGLGAVVALVAVTAIQFSERFNTIAVAASVSEAAAIPSVSLVSPAHEPATTPLTLPGDVQAWSQAPIFGQVSGYVRAWYKDIGANVKQGELLAVVDSPTLDQQLSQAQAQLAVTQANYELAVVTAQRWKQLYATRDVSLQDSDIKQTSANALAAQVNAAKSNVAQYAAREAFKNIVAPFDGIVTARQTDVGDYVTGAGGDAGTTGQAHALFTVADIHTLRVYVSVPQNYSAGLSPGVNATVTLPQLPNRIFQTHDLTTARALDLKSRTVLTQVVLDNPAGEILPGSYGDVRFDVPTDQSVLDVPEQALLFRSEGMQVALVDPSNKIHLQRVILGHNSGSTVQVVSGLKASDRLVANPSQGLLEGEAVRIVTVPPQNSNDKAVMAQGSGQKGSGSEQASE